MIRTPGVHRSGAGRVGLRFERVDVADAQGVQGAGLVEPEEGVVAVDEDGGDVVAPVVPLGVVDRADGAVAEFVGEQVGPVAAGEDEQACSGAAACSTSSGEPGRAGGTGRS
nr:hypothetical protein [Saccharothrix yanglingensis]